MRLQNEKIEALSFVRADLNYWAPSSERPRTYDYDPSNGEPKTNIVPEPRALPIYDARPERLRTTKQAAGNVPEAFQPT